MGILNNSDANEERVEKQFEKMFSEGEHVVIAYKMVRDLIILTNYRLITVDKQGLTGRKKNIISYPLFRLVKHQFENAPYLDFDNEIAIWFEDVNQPVKFTFSKGTNVYEFIKLLTTYAVAR